MKRDVIVGLTALHLLTCAMVAHGQLATERFIPIGQSPGLSGKTTYIGSIQAVDAAARTLTVAAAEGALKVRIADRTSIWVDRSLLRQTNAIGTLADLRSGRRVEVKWDAKVKDVAEWIKVEAAP